MRGKGKSSEARPEWVYVVIPAYNEATRVGSVVRSLPKTINVGAKTFKTKAIVIDDCSRDGTRKEAQSAGATVLRHAINSGAGAATRTGLRYADLNNEHLAYVVTIDADGQHSGDDVRRIVQYAAKQDAKMVVGNRMHADNKTAMPAHRAVGNWGLGLVSRALFGVRTKDTQSGLRLFHATVLPVVSDYTIDRYGFCTEMLWLAVRNGVDVREMPISVKYSAEVLAKGQSNWGAIDLIRDLLWIRISR